MVYDYSSKGGDDLFDGKLVSIKCQDILSGNSQKLDEYELMALAESIRENGIIVPLLVRPEKGGKYLLISGRRRLQAGILAGLKRLPCIVKRTDDITAECFTVIENIQRRQLSPFEEADALSRLISDYGLTDTDVAAKLGMAPSLLADKLRLCSLDCELKQRITAARLSERHAKALLSLPPEDRSDALNHIIAEGLTFSQTEKYVDELLSPPKQREEPLRKCAVGDLRLFANSLNKMVNTMRSGGIRAEAKRFENETHIEYTVMIRK